MPSSTSTAKTDLSAALKQAIEKSGHTNYTLSQLSGPSHTTRHAGPHRAVQFFRSEAVRLLTPLTGRSRGNQDSSDIPRTCRPCLHLCRQPVPPLSRRTWGISAFRWDLFSRPLGSVQEMISLETSECEIVCDWIDEQSQGRDSCNHQFVVKR